MDIFLEPLAELIKPPWRYILAILAVVVVITPRLIDLRRNFLDAQMGRRRLEFEKLSLEVLKLRAELEQMTQREKAPDLDQALKAIPAAPRAAPAVPEEPPQKGRPGRLGTWLREHSGFGRALMLLLQIVFGFWMIVFALSAVTVPAATWGEPDIGIAVVVLIVIVYAVLAWLCYLGFAKTRAVRKELASL